MMALAIVVFVSGTKRYKINPPNGSIIGRSLNICYEAYWVNRNSPSNTEHTLDKAAVENGGSFTFKQVAAVKFVVRLFPFLLVLVPYWGIYSQMSTGFQNQGCQMNLSLGSINIPVSALNLFNTIAILGLVPVFDSYIYPALKAKGYGLSILDKIQWGFFFAALAMVVAGLVEVYRLENKATAGDYYDNDAKDNISPCQDIDNYSPYEYQKWYAGEVRTVLSIFNDIVAVILLMLMLFDVIITLILLTSVSSIMYNVFIFLG